MRYSGECLISRPDPIAAIDHKTKEPWYLFRKGEKLFDPSILRHIPNQDRSDAKILSKSLNKMKAENKIKYIGDALKANENYGIPMSELRKSDAQWLDLLFWIRNSALHS